MQHIFISNQAIQRPAFFTKYYNANGESYQRIENELTPSLFQKDCSAVKIELWQNCANDNKAVPTFVKVIHRAY